MADTNQRTVEIILKAQDANASLKEMAAGAGVMTAQLSKMGQDDPGRAQLLADLQTMNQRLAAGRAEMRATIQTEEQLREATANLAAENLRVVVNGQQVAASFDEMKQAAALLERELHQISADDPGRARLLADYRALQGRIEDVRQEMGQATQQGSKFKDMLGLVGIAFTAEAALEGVTSIGKAIFDTTSKFETFGVVLKSALGSESAAQLAMHDIQTMAAKTPFSVDELTSSFIKFVNRGLQPSMAEMTKMADIAASQGKSFEQLTEAVLDAATGEFDRLKDFGIEASKNGDKVSLAFKGVKKEVANTPEAITAAMMSFGELNGVMGQTAAISQTLEGQTSNLGDTADQVAIQYGQMLKPAFVAIISTIGFFLGMLASLPGFVRENRGAILALAGAIMTFNAPMIQANALLLYNAALSKGKVVWDWAVTASTKAWEMAQRGVNLALAANPIGAVIAVGMLLVGLLVMLYDKSEKVRAVVAGLGTAFMAFVNTLKNGVMQNLQGMALLLEGIFTMNPTKIKAGIDAVGQSIKTVMYDAGKNAGAAFVKGYDEKLAAEQAAKAGKAVDAKAEAEAARKKAEAAAKAKAAADQAAHLEALKTEEANLKVHLAQVEKGTRAEMKLKQQLLRVQAEMELADEKKTANEKRVIRAEMLDKVQDLERDYTKKLAADREEERKKLEKHAEELRKKEQAHLHAIQDLRVAAIRDDHMRELAEIDLHHQRKIEALTGSEEQITEQKLLLEQLRKEKVDELLAKWDEEAKAKKEEEAQAQAEVTAAADEEYLAYLENKVANGLMTEAEYQEQLYRIKKEGLENQLKLLVDAGQGETAEAKRIRAALLRVETEHTNAVKNKETELQYFRRNIGKVRELLQNEEIDSLMEHFGKQSAIYQTYKTLRKSAELADVGINLVAELQAIWKNANANPLNSVTAGGAGVAQGVALSTLAVARAVGAGVKIAAFAKGGRTDAGQALPMSMLASLLSGASGGSAAPRSTFAGGGPVEKATIGLIGEAGAELVIPNWLYADPKQANLMGFLEAQIASRGGAFAAGGGTGPSPVAPATLDDTSGAMLDVLERIARGQQAFQEKIETWQTNLEVNLNLVETKKGLDVVTQTQSGGGIK